MEPPARSLAARLADLRARLDHPPGVPLGRLRLPILDPVLDELETVLLSGDEHGPTVLEPQLLEEIERMVDLLTGEWLGAASEAQAPRLRLVELLRRVDGGRLPPRAFDPGDAFGAELRAMIETDDELRATLGSLFPLMARATSVAPSARWQSDARAALRAGGAAAADAIRRSLAALVRAEIVSRPDLLVGGMRLANQRLARGLLWLAPVVVDRPAELLVTVGLRMGTSGRADAVVRDTALANTCAALLGAVDDPGAAPALVSMRARITNRNVLKQVDRALAAVAERSGVPVEAVIDLALPDFGLDAERSRRWSIGDVTATVVIGDDGDVRVTWRLADGTEQATAPRAAADRDPAAVAEVLACVEEVRAAVADERRRMEDRMGTLRTWPERAWRARFIDHPIGGLFGRRLLWQIAPGQGPTWDALPAGDGWITDDGDQRPGGGASEFEVRLWHPADTTEHGAVAWRAVLVAQGIEQPIPQVEREAFWPRARDRHLAADRRFAGRVVDHGRLRALLRERGWAAPFVGSWDQGDTAIAWRSFDDCLRAELQYQAVETLPTGARHSRVRLVAVRFVRADAAPAAPASEAISVRLDSVPARAFSEAIRDVALVVAVAEAG